MPPVYASRTDVVRDPEVESRGVIGPQFELARRESDLRGRIPADL